LCKDWWRH